jgi:hypothetical protein
MLSFTTGVGGGDVDGGGVDCVTDGSSPGVTEDEDNIGSAASGDDAGIGKTDGSGDDGGIVEGDEDEAIGDDSGIGEDGGKKAGAAGRVTFAVSCVAVAAVVNVVAARGSPTSTSTTDAGDLAASASTTTPVAAVVPSILSPAAAASTAGTICTAGDGSPVVVVGKLLGSLLPGIAEIDAATSVTEVDAGAAAAASCGNSAPVATSIGTPVDAADV